MDANLPARPPGTVRATYVAASGGFAITVIAVGNMTNEQAQYAASIAAVTLASTVRSLWTQA